VTPSPTRSVDLAVANLRRALATTTSTIEALDALTPGRPRPWYEQEFPTEADCEEMAEAIAVAQAHLVASAVAIAYLRELHPPGGEIADIARQVRIAVGGLERIHEQLL
jgi:hypothetical protein